MPHVSGSVWCWEVNEQWVYLTVSPGVGAVKGTFLPKSDQTDFHQQGWLFDAV